MRYTSISIVLVLNTHCALRYKICLCFSYTYDIWRKPFEYHHCSFLENFQNDWKKIMKSKLYKSLIIRENLTETTRKWFLLSMLQFSVASYAQIGGGGHGGLVVSKLALHLRSWGFDFRFRPACTEPACSPHRARERTTTIIIIYLYIT